MKFVLLILERHQSSGGWVRIEEIQDRCGVSKATAYRYIGYALEGGMPLVMDSDDGKRRRASENLGVRCNLVAAPRPPDQMASARRECMTSAGGMNPHTVVSLR